MTLRLVSLVFLWTVASCQQYPFQDINLSFEERAEDLVSRLTVDEMMLQMARGGTSDYGGPAPPIPRLGIGPYQWVAECLRGDARAQENATAFPQALGQAAVFSPSFHRKVSEAIGREVRGKHNDFVKRGIFASHTGASCFSPVINIVRDSRWGRIQETYGEDPFMSGVLAQEYVYGIQGNDSRYIMASAGCKHFDVHGGPEEIRGWFDAQVDDYTWRMNFLPAFRKCVMAGTYSLMCSYNAVNGIPACAHKELLTDILRTEWNFTGYVISDQQAIENIVHAHHYRDTYVDAAAAAVNAGCNLELSSDLPQNVYMSIADAVDQGKITEETLRNSVKPLFLTRMALGEFDPPDNNPYAKLDNSVVETPEHQELAIKAAEKSFVLLKNRDYLPLDPDEIAAINIVGVIGPMADNYDQIFGDYRPNQDRAFTKTPLEGIRLIFPSARLGKACEDGNRCTSYNPDVVHGVAEGADLVFVVLGTGTDVEMEGFDRPDVELAGYQGQLLQDALNYSGSADVVLLLFNTGPLNLTFAEENDRVVAILECFLSSQGTGDALYNVLTNLGGNSSPAGRLPVTWPQYDWQMPPSVNYSMAGRTYRYYIGDPLYPFGYGLSYSRFQYDELELTDLQGPQENLKVVVRVTNVGTFDADEVIQCYITWDNSTLPTPIRQLVYFERIHIQAGQQAEHKFSILWDNFAIRDSENPNLGWLIQEGPMTLYCGGQQPDQAKKVPSNILSAKFNIPSSLWLPTLIY